MKIVIIRSHLKEGLSMVQGGVGENLNLPVLKNVLIEALGSKITCTTTNLELAITYTIPGKVIEQGKTTLLFSPFLQVISNLTHERINFENKHNINHITTDNYHAKLQGTSTDDFPIIPKIINPSTHFVLPSGVFKSALAEVIPAAQFSDLRPELSAVLLWFSIDAIRLVATDSFRLAEKTIPKQQFTTNHQTEFKLLIPLKTSQELLRTLKEDEQLTITHDKNQALFSTETIQITSRLIDGVFPEYQPIIPKKFSTETTINRQELISAIKLTSVFGSSAHEVRLRPAENQKTFEVFSLDTIVGENTYILSAKISGSAKETTFNWRYLLDGLKALKTEDVFLGLNDETKPTLLRSPTDSSYFYILMPILKG